ncbi:MAG: ATP-binding protein [Verrucomicrobia bacterium]|nr:ATP-binding protein [Verrucomicrobiota bacterium]
MPQTYFSTTADRPNVLPPMTPSSVAETGMSLTQIAELAMKILYVRGELTAQNLVQEICLPYEPIIKAALEYLLKEQLAARAGSRGLGETGFVYVLSLKGAERARELMEVNQYAGPAPVTLADYHAVVEAQTITSFVIEDSKLRRALAHLVVGDELLEKLGPAVNSARSIFLHGPPGDGKTVIAEALSTTAVGEVYIPHAISVEGYIVRVFDPIVHEPVLVAEEGKPPPLATVGSVDQRWVLCSRPTISVGGELTMDMLEMIYDQAAKTYEAPLQMKANGGTFIIDDFGRQRVHPRDLLNRWIVPLEKRVDYLPLLRGKKVEFPFDVLIVFSTNIAPTELVDEAFLRRIRHKIRVGDPTPQQFHEIFVQVCRARNVPFEEAGYNYLLRTHYQNNNRPLRAVHPRDLVDQIVDIAGYLRVAPALKPDLIDRACRSYFVDLSIA